MIIFHEGLPGSGKSYEALCYRIIPALAKGRAVVAYVEGLDHERIASLAKISVDRCRELLTPLTREQCASVLDHVKDNALHVFDEAQNFWGNKERMSKDMTEFVTEHRHRGMDIVLMGQDYRDVHSLWRRRIEIKLAFLKLSGIGAAKSYSVTTWKHKGGDDYVKVGTEVHKYDPKFFGTYKSHTSDEINTGDYKDGRAMILNNAGFRYGVPVVIALAVWGGFKAWAFFHPQPVPATAPAAVERRPAVMAGASAPGPAATAAPVPAKPDARSVQERRFADLSGKARIRLAGLISMGRRTSGYIEWVDGNTHVMERLTLDALRDLGVSVVLSEGSVRLTLGEWSELATSWPLEAEGRVSEARLERMRPERELQADTPFAAMSLGGTRPAPPSREPAGDMSVSTRRQ